MRDILKVGSSGRGPRRGANSFIRHCHADNRLHCELTGKGASMHFVVHLLQHILMIHFGSEDEGKIGRNNGHLDKEKFDTVKQAK